MILEVICSGHFSPFWPHSSGRKKISLENYKSSVYPGLCLGNLISPQSLEGWFHGSMGIELRYSLDFMVPHHLEGQRQLRGSPPNVQSWTLWSPWPCSGKKQSRKGHDKYCQPPYEECNQTDNSKADHSNLTPQFLPSSGLTFWSVAYSAFSSEPVVWVGFCCSKE